MIRREREKYPSFRPRFKIVICPDETEILAQVQLSQSPPTIAHQSDILCPEAGKAGTEISRIGYLIVADCDLLEPDQSQGVSSEDALQGSEGHTPQLESVAFTPQERKAAAVIERLIKRHRRRAGGIIAAAFERLAKKLEENIPIDKLDRSLLLCVRGPLPHVLAFVRTMRNLSQEAIESLNRDIQYHGHEDIEELHAKGVEVR